MPRTLLLYPLPAVLIASGWARLDDRSDDALALGLLVLALLPALVRPHWGRAVAALGVTLLAVDAIYGLAPGRDYLGAVWSRFSEGVLGFYDVELPFVAADEPLLHEVTLVATFGFALAVALALAARRPVAASVSMLLGAVWPVAIVPGNDLVRGAILLATVLLLLALGGRRPTQAPRPALVAGGLLVAAAVAASTSAAVAKPQFLAWEDWDLYDRPDDPVSVGFLWNASYNGFTWPERKTTVLKVRGPERRLYWRATTLDTFARDHWIEDVPFRAFVEGEVDATEVADAQLPKRAYDRRRWTRAEIEVLALRDPHLVAPATPVAYETRAAFALGAGGVATASEPLPRGTTYTVWSYSPRPKPQQLARAGNPDFELVRRYLEVAPGLALPVFGEPGRDGVLRRHFEARASLARYRPLYERAREIVGTPTNQYAAVFGLEAWFRSEGGFVYDERPPATGGLPPLVAFLDHQRGYCQLYAGTMALMLRFLGVPARVAVGFTSGSWDAESRVWTVTDHDAHAWVEVWFPKWGWLPFDPTPARGQFTSPYSAGGTNLDAAGAADVLAQSEFGGTDGEIAARIRGLSERKAGEQFSRGDGGGGGSGIVRERGASLLKLLLIVVAVAAAAIQLVKRAVRGRRFLTRDPRRLAAACRRDLVDFLADQGIELPRSATPRELAAELRRTVGVDAREFARALAAARYGPAPDSRVAGRRLRRELRSLRRAIRLRLGVPRRVRGAVSLRSLAA